MGDGTNITDDLTFIEMGLPEASDAAQNRSFWGLLALCSAAYSQWSMRILDIGLRLVSFIILLHFVAVNVWGLCFLLMLYIN